MAVDRRALQGEATPGRWEGLHSGLDAGPDPVPTRPLRLGVPGRAGSAIEHAFGSRVNPVVAVHVASAPAGFRATSHVSHLLRRVGTVK